MKEIIKPNPVTGYLELTTADIGKYVAFGTDPTVRDRLWDNKKDMIWVVLDVFLDGTALFVLYEKIDKDFYLEYKLNEYEREKYRCINEKYYQKIINSFFDSVFAQAERDIIIPPLDSEKARLCTLDISTLAKYRELIFTRLYDCRFEDCYYCCVQLSNGQINYRNIQKNGSECKYASIAICPTIKVCVTQEARERVKIEAERKRKAIEEAERVRLEKERETLRKEEERRALVEERKKNGLCLYCGGKFKLIKKVCKDCGKRKNY